MKLRVAWDDEHNRGKVCDGTVVGYVQNSVGDTMAVILRDGQTPAHKDLTAVRLNRLRPTGWRRNIRIT